MAIRFFEDFQVPGARSGIHPVHTADHREYGFLRVNCEPGSSVPLNGVLEISAYVHRITRAFSLYLTFNNRDAQFFELISLTVSLMPFFKNLTRSPLVSEAETQHRRSVFIQKYEGSLPPSLVPQVHVDRPS